MHLGSMKTFNHASWVFSNGAALGEEYNTRATACLSLAGICLTVRTGSSHIASKVGRGLGIAPLCWMETAISRNRPYIGGHLAIYFQIEFKHV